MLRKSFYQFVKYKLFFSFQRPFFYIAAIIYTIGCSLYYFLGTGLFVGNGTSDLRLFFSSFPYMSILIIPLLCYKTQDTRFSELLPLSVMNRICADYISFIIQFGIMNLALITIPVRISLYGDIDPGQVFTGFLMVFFYASSCFAVCILYREFFSAQIALILSSFTIAVTVLSENIVLLTSTDVSNVVKYINFSYYFDAASKGIIDTRDIFFYLIVTVLLLYISAAVHDVKKGRKYTAGQKRGFFLFLVVLLFAFLDSSEYYSRIDTTRTKQFTVSEYSKKMIAEINEPLKITYFCSPELTKYYPQTKDVFEYIRDFSLLNSKIKISLVNPDNEKINSLLRDYGIQSQQIRTGTINKVEYLSVYSAIVIEYMGKTKIIPFEVSTNTIEYDLDRCLSMLLTGKQIKVLLLCGNGLSLDKDYSYVLPWLSVHDMNAEEIKCNSEEYTRILSEEDAGKEILVVFGCSELSEDDCAFVEEYVLQGGNALFAVSPYSADIKESWKIKKDKNTSFTDMISRWGFSFTPYIIADISCARVTMTSDADKNNGNTNSQQTVQMNYPLWINILPQANAAEGMYLFWASPLTIENENIKPLLATSNYSWEIEEGEDPENCFETNPFIVQNAKAGVKQQYVPAAVFKGKIEGAYSPRTGKEARVVVIGDQYFADSLMMEYAGGEKGDYRNLDFLVQMILRLSGEKELAALQNRKIQSFEFYKITDDVEFQKSMLHTYIIVFAVIPVCFLFLFLAMVFYRKFLNKKMNEELKKNEQ